MGRRWLQSCSPNGTQSVSALCRPWYQRSVEELVVSETEGASFSSSSTLLWSSFGVMRGRPCLHCWATTLWQACSRLRTRTCYTQAHRTPRPVPRRWRFWRCASSTWSFGRRWTSPGAHSIPWTGTRGSHRSPGTPSCLEAGWGRWKVTCACRRGRKERVIWRKRRGARVWGRSNGPCYCCDIKLVFQLQKRRSFLFVNQQWMNEW